MKNSISLTPGERLHQIFAAGFLPVPYLWQCRDEFRNAVQWPTRVIKGSVKVVDEMGQVLPPPQRAQMIVEVIRGNLPQPVVQGIEET